MVHHDELASRRLLARIEAMPADDPRARRSTDHAGRELTDKERYALLAAAAGLSNAEAADVLGMSVHSIQRAIDRACVVLRAKNRTHAVAVGLRTGAIT